MQDRIDICHNLHKLLLFWNFLPLQRARGLALRVYKAYVVYDFAVFDLVRAPAELPQFRAAAKLKAKQQSSSKLFRFQWLSPGKRADRSSGGVDTFEERARSVKSFGDFGDVERLKKYEITR